MFAGLNALDILSTCGKPSTSSHSFKLLVGVLQGLSPSNMSMASRC